MALHHRALTVAQGAALVALIAASGCSLRSDFTGGGEAGSPDSGTNDAGPCSADGGGYPRCEDGTNLVDCIAGEESVSACDSYGCNEMFGAHCNECPPGMTTCSPTGDLVECNVLGEADVRPCLSMACSASPVECLPCTDAPPTCYGGEILSCTGGVQVVEDDCPDGYGCGDLPAPHCNACPPGVVYCAPSGDLVDCSADGTVGVFVEDCPGDCSDLPTPHCNECTPGVPACDLAGNVRDCPDGLFGAVLQMCPGGLCGGGTCQAAIAPSNVPASVLADAALMPLEGWTSAFAGCAPPWDAVVVDPDSGEIRCFAGTSSRGTARGSGLGHVDGIFFAVTGGGGGAPAIGVFVLADLVIASGERVRVTGTNAVAFVATGCVTIDGELLAGGGVYTTGPGVPFTLAVDDGSIAGGGNIPGPGGFAGGEADGSPPADGPGAGGGGVAGAEFSAGGGGGFGGAGGPGGPAVVPDPDVPGGPGGSAYFCGGTGAVMSCAGGATDFNAALVPLVGGSGGGGVGETTTSGRGSAGGGAVEIVSLSACGVTVGAGGRVDVGGEGGRGGSGDNRAGGGGGAGGAILLEGYRVVVLGGLTANGGGGGGGDDEAGMGAVSAGGRGRLDGIAAAGGNGVTQNGGNGGTGGAGGAVAGGAGEMDNAAPGGGGGAAGRIRINAFEIETSGAGTLVSPASGTSAFSTGVPVTP